MENLNNRLRKLRIEKHYSMNEIAKKLGLSVSAIYKYEIGKAEPNSDALLKLANIYNVSIEYLLTGKNEEDVKPRGLKIPVLGSIPAGIPIEAIEEVLDYEEIPLKWANTGEFFALKVKGNSMLPRIKSGDVVIVRKQEDAESGDLCIVMVNGFDATLKQIKKEPNGITLVPFNSEYAPAFYSNEDIKKLPLRILGKVVELRAKF